MIWFAVSFIVVTLVSSIVRSSLNSLLSQTLFAAVSNKADDHPLSILLASLEGRPSTIAQVQCFAMIRLVG